jgi:hypothetical protein
MFPTIEELQNIVATTGLDTELAIGYWRDQQAFNQIGLAMRRQQSITYDGLSDAGKRFADELRGSVARVQSSAWS